MTLDEHIFSSGFRYKHNTYKIKSLYALAKRGDLNIEPSFRNHTNWSIAQRSNFIESIYLGMPIGQIIGEEDLYGNVTILDGAQRLKTIIDFLDNKFSLKDLKIIAHLNNKKFEDLYYNDQSLIRDRINIELLTLSYDTHSLLKFEFFKRINFGKNRFPIQSARNYAYPTMRKFLLDIKREMDTHLKIHSENYSTSKEELTSQSDLDQLYLYLAMIVLIKNNRIEINSLDESINDLLDRSALIINDTLSYGHHINSISHDISYVTARVVGSHTIEITLNERKYRSNEYKRSRHTPEHWIVNAEKFIHVFISKIYNFSENEVELEDVLDSDFITPSYLDTRKNCRLLIREIFGRKYVKDFETKKRQMF